MMSKKKKLMAAAAICTAVFMAGSITLSSITLYHQLKLNRLVYGEVNDPAREDDVEIAGEYEIKSTLKISDAYKSGDTSKLSDRDKETLDMAKEVIDKVITDEMTDYEKEQAIYRYLTKDLTGSTGLLTVIRENRDTENDNPHDVLKNHSAVCVGYATTFRMFMQMMDIECMVVHSSDLIHSWNLIKLDDGCWYHTDCYMDSGESNYANFNMDDTTCSQSHDWNTDFFPSANGSKYNYILSICDVIKDIYAIPEWVMKATQERKNVISCTFKEEITSENEELAAYMAESLEDSINYSDKLYVSSRWTENDNGQYVLCFYFEYEDSTGETLSDKTREKVEDTIGKAMDKYNFYDNFYENYDDYEDYEN